MKKAIWRGIFTVHWKANRKVSLICRIMTET